MFSFYTGEGNVRLIPASIAWDLDENAGSPYVTDYDPDGLKKRVNPVAIRNLQKYREELQEMRNHQSMIKEKYGVRSLDHLILKLDGELIELYTRRGSFSRPVPVFFLLMELQS